MLNKEASMLRNIELFANLDSAKLKLLAFTSQQLNFGPGDTLYNQGDLGDSAYLITKGIVEVLVKTEGDPILVATRSKNDIIGEMSILCDEPRTATVKASDDVSALKISKDVFLQLLSGSPEMAVEIIRILARRLHSASTELSEVKAKLV